MLSYIGGKSRIAPKLIIPNIPNDIEKSIINRAKSNSKRSNE
jgi:hypothetical protein